MAFENVDVKRARSALQDLKNSLIYNEEQSIYDSISNESNFKTLASNPLKDGLKKLIENRYKELVILIETYQKIVDYVEEYQELDKKVSRLKSQIENEYDDEDPSYSKINRLKREKSKCLTMMDEIINKIDSLI